MPRDFLLSAEGTIEKLRIFQEHFTSDVWSFSVIYIRNHMISMFFITMSTFFIDGENLNYMLKVVFA